jgi:hypothetical protein
MAEEQNGLRKATILTTDQRNPLHLTTGFADRKSGQGISFRGHAGFHFSVSMPPSIP